MSEAGRAFWSRSFAVAPEETVGAVRESLIELLSATDPYKGLGTHDLDQLPDEPRQVVRDLLQLAASLTGRLPGDLDTVQRLLRADSSGIPHPILVYLSNRIVRTSRWQQALIDKLNRDAGQAGAVLQPSVAAAFHESLEARAGAAPGSALRALQDQLFGPSAHVTAIDKSVQWVGVRDYFQEAETAAAMAQRVLAESPALRPAEIGILLPDTFEYSIAAEDAFRLAGLALSGVPGERWHRDLGREAVFYFLFCRQRPAPAMALAVCLSSLLMPWSAREGGDLARSVMRGRYSVDPPEGASRESRRILELLRGGDNDPDSIGRDIEEFVSLLAADEPHALHKRRAQQAAEEAREALSKTQEVDWVALRRIASPRYIAGSAPPFHNLEGVTVLRERQEAWRDVRHLFVLGFSEGRYPLPSRASAVFSARNIQTVRERLAIPLGDKAEELEFRRQRFRRQLCAASESVTFLVPRRRADGQVQARSESLVFMERLVSGSGKGAGLVAEQDSSEDRKRIRHLALAPAANPVAPRNFTCSDLQFRRNLIALRTDDDGRVRPESPSSLETLLVSPLAWLLRRIEAEPAGWAPETAGPSVIGSLVHGVFEQIFRPGVQLPDRAGMRSGVRSTLDEIAQQQAPFFRNPKWRVERRNLAEQAARAATVWLDALNEVGAEVIGSEQWLQGTWSGIGVHGQADLILALGEDRLAIVDYKWARSPTRRKRMKSGFDSQATLYRAMAETGGPKARLDGTRRPEHDALAKRLRRGAEFGIVYFMMRDRVCLADWKLPLGVTVPGWQALDEDIASVATARIRERLGELIEGVVRLNRETDRESFDEAGISPYALEASPLIELLIQPAAGRSE